MLACHFVEHSIGEKEAAKLQVGANVPEKFLFDGIHYFTTHNIYIIINVLLRRFGYHVVGFGRAIARWNCLGVKMIRV